MAGAFRFWAGFLAGGLTVGGIAALCRNRQSSATPAGSTTGYFRSRENRIPLKRDLSENMGDPARLTSTRANSFLSPGFERLGGAPGPNSEAEVLDTPGRPGQTVDTDISQPVQPSPRSLDLTGS